MTIVIDVGAARYGDDHSMERLIVRFEPTELHAFDPNPALEYPDPQVVAELFAAKADGSEMGQTYFHLYRRAAWTFDGEIPYREDGLNSWIASDGPVVPCTDLAKFIEAVHLDRDGPEIVLKLDCEGAEYDILPHVIARGADRLLKLCIVEWHPKTRDDSGLVRSLIEADIRCELEEWPY